MYKYSLLIILLALQNSVFGVDLGKHGQSFAIEEEGFIEMIKRKLAEIDINKEQQKMQAIARDRVENPKGGQGIEAAITSRVFYFDPSYTLEEDAVLPCGKILHKAGTKVNPLEHMDLNRRLFFIDARKNNQVAWLQERLNNPLAKQEQKEQVEDRVILVGGSVFKLQELLGDEHADRVYFDQAGELTSKFGIKASPAVVEQEEFRLKIEEILIDMILNEKK
jgi:conjugal transfer pilus assembly protein TraW